MLCFRNFLVAKLFMDKRKGEVSGFYFGKFRLTVPKNFVGESFRVSLISSNKKLYAQVDYVTTFRRKFFVFQYRNVSWTNSSMLCFKKLLVAKKFMDRKGEYHDFSSKYFYLTVPK